MKSVAVIGLSQFGSQLAIGLTQKGIEVIGIDKNPDIVDEIKDLISQAIILDAADEKAMRAVNIDNIDAAIVAFGSNVQSSLLTAALLLKLGISKIHVRAINSLQASILHTMGIEHVINIEKEMGTQLANTITDEKIDRYVQISERHSLLEIAIPHLLIGKTLKELHLRANYGINIVGVKSKVPEVNNDGELKYKTKMADLPDPSKPFKKEDILVIYGTDDNIRNFLRKTRSDDE